MPGVTRAIDGTLISKKGKKAKRQKGVFTFFSQKKSALASLQEHSPFYPPSPLGGIEGGLNL
jgi:hypothetical protein